LVIDQESKTLPDAYSHVTVKHRAILRLKAE